MNSSALSLLRVNLPQLDKVGRDDEHERHVCNTWGVQSFNLFNCIRRETIESRATCRDCACCHWQWWLYVLYEVLPVLTAHHSAATPRLKAGSKPQQGSILYCPARAIGIVVTRLVGIRGLSQFL